MLAKVEVTNKQGSTLVLPLGEAVEGFFVKDIDGLDPVKATLVSSSFAQQDGEQYQSSRREKRNLVFKLGFELGPRTGTIRDIRRKLYQFLMPKSEAYFRFYDDDGTYVDIDGRVESNETALFSKEPEAVISVLCFDPDFYDPHSVIVSGSTTSDTSEFVMQYDGSVETGFVFNLAVGRDLPEVTIFSRTPDGVMTSLQFVAPLVAGDVLRISTISGAKGASYIRNGNDNPVLYGVSPYSNWINLFPGLNYIRVYAEGAVIPYTIEYTNKFGGL